MTELRTLKDFEKFNYHTFRQRPGFRDDGIAHKDNSGFIRDEELGLFIYWPDLKQEAIKWVKACQSSETVKIAGKEFEHYYATFDLSVFEHFFNISEADLK